jgi:hypothetical protein
MWLKCLTRIPTALLFCLSIARSGPISAQALGPVDNVEACPSANPFSCQSLIGAPIGNVTVGSGVGGTDGVALYTGPPLAGGFDVTLLGDGTGGPGGSKSTELLHGASAEFRLLCIRVRYPVC